MSVRYGNKSSAAKMDSFGGLICSIVASLELVLVLVLDWNRWWLILIILFLAVVGVAWSSENKDELGVIGVILGAVCAAAALLYCLYGIEQSSHDKVESRTILACGLDTHLDDDGNIEWIIRTPDGSYSIKAGTYYVLKDGVLRKTFAVSARDAAQLFTPNTSFEVTVTVTRFMGDFDTVTTGKQVPSGTLGTCSD